MEEKTQESARDLIYSNRHSMMRYLGDAVYVHFDGCSIILITSDGIKTTNTIVLEPQILARLIEYVRDLERALEITILEKEKPQTL